MFCLGNAAALVGTVGATGAPKPLVNCGFIVIPGWVLAKEDMPGGMTPIFPVGLNVAFLFSISGLYGPDCIITPPP